MAPPKAKVMIRVSRGMLANLRQKPPSHDGMPPNLLGGGCHFAGGKMAGLVLGAARPVILTSRNETAYGKVASIALAAYSVVSARQSAKAEERVGRQ